MKSKTCLTFALFLTLVLSFNMGCAEPLSKREQGGLGGDLGAGAGAIIGSTVGHAAVGALIGGPIGLIGGALIGDRLMSQDKKQNEQEFQIDRNRDELARLRKENQTSREQSGEF
jgi:outer membrane lipoprotein SlyB